MVCTCCEPKQKGALAPFCFGRLFSLFLFLSLFQAFNRLVSSYKNHKTYFLYAFSRGSFLFIRFTLSSRILKAQSVRGEERKGVKSVSKII
ncbi:hypothetical protein ADH67_09700 [Turicimonas muris]|uniref:Uncharacterized protein n=1 Tax=Turicimonas muris TaxID=1796652 RepID=A0A227KE60_9BURK|nr:hypothetical protein ADH67_09700 [Turicimonas muris]